MTETAGLFSFIYSMYWEVISLLIICKSKCVCEIIANFYEEYLEFVGVIPTFVSRFWRFFRLQPVFNCIKATNRDNYLIGASILTLIRTWMNKFSLFVNCQATFVNLSLSDRNNPKNINSIYLLEWFSYSSDSDIVDHDIPVYIKQSNN